MKKSNKYLLSVAVSAALAPSASFAQLEEVVVTAQKREQNLQDVPIAISAVSQEIGSSCWAAWEAKQPQDMSRPRWRATMIAIRNMSIIPATRMAAARLINSLLGHDAGKKIGRLLHFIRNALKFSFFFMIVFPKKFNSLTA